MSTKEIVIFNNAIPESALLIMMIDAAMMQAAQIKGTPIVFQEVKQGFTPFFNYGRKLTRELTKSLERQGAAEAYDEVAPFIYEALREIISSKNKLHALALLKSYNAGEVIIQEN